MQKRDFKAIDWASLIERFGPVFISILEMLIQRFEEDEQRQNATAPIKCPADVQCYCEEALRHTIDASVCLAACCCHDHDHEV